jgi:hypothetical protein
MTLLSSLEIREIARTQLQIIQRLLRCRPLVLNCAREAALGGAARRIILFACADCFGLLSPL